MYKEVFLFHFSSNVALYCDLLEFIDSTAEYLGSVQGIPCVHFHFAVINSVGMKILEHTSALLPPVNILR
jgi:hypothetical protein